MDQALIDAISSLAIIGGLGIGVIQLQRSIADARARDRDRRVERALELYRDLVVDGETAAAFHRLSVFLRRRGTALYGVTTWFLLGNKDLEVGGLLDPEAAEGDTEFRDLYQVLWFLERVETSADKGLVDADVLMQTIGFHCWWWAEMLRDVSAPKAIRAVKSLGPKARAWAVRTGEFKRWADSCRTDFGGGPATEFATPPSSGRAETSREA